MTRAPTQSEYSAVCLALRQQTRRIDRALELLDRGVHGGLGVMTIEEVERIINEAHSILKDQ